MEHTPWSYREGNKMVSLPKPVYAAVQRALTNMLAGREAPLEEAIEAVNWEYGTHVQLVQVAEPLADYVHLLVRQLPSIPELVEVMLASRTEQLHEHIAEERLRLHQLGQAEAELSQTVAYELADLRGGLGIAENICCNGAQSNLHVAQVLEDVAAQFLTNLLHPGLIGHQFSRNARLDDGRFQFIQIRQEPAILCG